MFWLIICKSVLLAEHLKTRVNERIFYLRSRKALKRNNSNNLIRVLEEENEIHIGHLQSLVSWDAYFAQVRYLNNF